MSAKHAQASPQSDTGSLGYARIIGYGYGSDTLRRVQNESVDSPCTESIMPPTLSKFQDGEAKLDRTSTFGSASGSSPAKGKRRKGWEDEIREAVDVAIKISPKLNGVVSIMFPKQHVQLREVVKLIMVDDIFACNFLKTAKMWCNVDWDCDIRKPILTCHPVEFVDAAYATLESSEHCRTVTVLDQNGRPISVDDVHKIDFNLTATWNEKTDNIALEVQATNDDLQRDIRCLMRVLKLVSVRAGVTEAEIVDSISDE